MFREVEEFLEASRAAQSDSQIEAIFAKSIEALGFDAFVAWTDGTEGIELPGGVKSDNFPEDWLSYYLDRQYWSVDPIYRLGVKTQHPFFWGDPAFTSQFNPREVELMGEAAHAGLQQGLVVPVRYANDRPGTVSVLGGADPGKGGAAVKLHNLAVYFYGLLRRSSQRRSARGSEYAGCLTQRERECLLWLAAGRTDWDISAILGVSESGVRLHVARAMRKLGVPTRTQAVAQAIITSQIIP